VTGEIHEEHPFATPEEERDPARRFRGRLTAPVTVVTAGSPEEPVGLTVSSVMVIEGDPPLVYVLLGPTTDLWLTLDPEDRFVVQVLRQEDRVTADRLAGLAPSPGGPFTGLHLVDNGWGPELANTTNRLRCRMVDCLDAGYHVIVVGEIEDAEIEPLDDPLVYFRGRYRRLAD
jgi:flavin reductase (DIM6/NTAB) family NADH-FMN oxidoreductase RutF